MPVRDRLTCSVQDAMDASGLGRTKINALMNDGRLESIKIDDRRLVKVKSLKQLLGVDLSSKPTELPTSKHIHQRA
jgi:hypothetical protein